MKEILDFLNELSENNNKEWFDANRSRYNAAKETFMALVDKLIIGLSEIDPLITPMRAQDCMYRINRDIRFSSNKAPYKTHIGAFIAPGGKNSGLAGYYFHVEAKKSDFIGGHVLSVGVYCPEKKALDSIRTDIFDMSEEFVALLEKTKGFELDCDNMLKKAPKGYPADFKYVDLLKHKDYFVSKSIPEDVLFSKDLDKYLIKEYKNTVGLVSFINRAIKFEE